MLAAPAGMTDQTAFREAAVQRVMLLRREHASKTLVAQTCLL